MSESPVLTDVQKLTLQNLVLRAKLATAEVEKMGLRLAVDGYDLTEEGDYVPKQAS